MVDPIALTIDALILTFRGDVPLETWFPLIGDIFVNVGTMILNLLGVA